MVMNVRIGIFHDLCLSHCYCISTAAFPVPIVHHTNIEVWSEPEPLIHYPHMAQSVMGPAVETADAAEARKAAQAKRRRQEDAETVAAEARRQEEEEDTAEYCFCWFDNDGWSAADKESARQQSREAEAQERAERQSPQPWKSNEEIIRESEALWAAEAAEIAAAASEVKRLLEEQAAADKQCQEDAEMAAAEAARQEEERRLADAAAKKQLEEAAAATTNATKDL